MCEFDQRMNIVVISLSAQINKVKRLKYLASTTGPSYTCTFNTGKKYILHHIYIIYWSCLHMWWCVDLHYFYISQWDFLRWLFLVLSNFLRSFSANATLRVFYSFSTFSPCGTLFHEQCNLLIGVFLFLCCFGLTVKNTIPKKKQVRKNNPTPPNHHHTHSSILVFASCSCIFNSSSLPAIIDNVPRLKA